jgi:mono/diheme cytochrome c family protein
MKNSNIKISAKHLLASVITVTVLASCSEQSTEVAVAVDTGPRTYTEAQAEAGETAFATNCATCHGNNLPAHWLQT